MFDIILIRAMYLEVGQQRASVAEYYHLHTSLFNIVEDHLHFYHNPPYRKRIDYLFTSSSLRYPDYARHFSTQGNEPG